jgi:hypothetical protein
LNLVTDPQRRARFTPGSLARGASLISGLALVLVAPHLPTLLPMATPRGRIAAGATLVILAGGAASALRAILRARNAAPAGSRARLLLGALLWVGIAIPPWQEAPSPLRAGYGLLAGILAPLAGLGWTVAAARLLLRRGTAARPAAPGAGPRQATWAAAAAFGITLLLGFFVLEHAPHVPDEITYLFDARTLAAGQRFASAPPVIESFPPPDWIEVEANRAYGVFPIGWPLLLAAGVKLGAPWLVNAVLVAGLVLAMAWLARGARGSSPANGGGGPGAATEVEVDPPAAAWLAALSPFLLFLGASFMAHPAAMLAAGVVLAATLDLERRAADPKRTAGPAIPAVPALLLMGAASLTLIRPAEAATLALALGWDAFAERRRAPARRRLALLSLSLGFVAGGLVLLADQARVTGDPFVPPVSRYFDQHFGPGSNRLGFGPDIGLAWDGSAPGHSPRESLMNLWRNLHALDRHLFGWPAGSLLLPLIGILAGRLRRAERLLARHGLLILGLYALYWYHGIAYGPRFMSALLPGLVIFTMRGAARVAAWWTRATTLPDPPRLVRAALGISVAVAIAIYLPLIAWVEFRHMRGVDGTLRRMVEAVPAPALCFVSGPPWPDFASLYDLNAPDFHQLRVIALARGAESDSALARLYPEHAAHSLPRLR